MRKWHLLIQHALPPGIRKMEGTYGRSVQNGNAGRNHHVWNDDHRRICNVQPRRFVPTANKRRS